MYSSEEKLARLRSLYDLARTSDDFEGGVTLEEEMEALIVGNWAVIAFDDLDELALSFHLDAHPNAVARLTRHLLEHGIGFALYANVVFAVFAVAVAGATVDTTALQSSIPVAGTALPENVRLFSPLFTIPGSVALIGIATYSY